MVLVEPVTRLSAFGGLARLPVENTARQRPIPYGRKDFN